MPSDSKEECNALGFADDLVISASNISDTVNISGRLNYFFNQIGLEQYKFKCITLSINIPNPPDA